MSLSLDMRKALRKSKVVKSAETPQAYRITDNVESKARHILGLDSTWNGPARNNSTSSTSTSKLRSETFSDATTAAASSSSREDVTKGEPLLTDHARQASAVLVKHNQKPEIHDKPIKPQQSNNSLRSFYDKNRAPLSVSQQTSNSSSRDFALRRGVPSIITASSQEMEHTRQLRFFSRSPKPPKHASKLHTTLKASPTNASQDSLATSTLGNRSETGSSVDSGQSTPRISITRGPSREIKKTPVLVQQRIEAEHPPPSVAPAIDPARAKMNVRRPKAGAKHWFDSLESDSSDDDTASAEPQLECDFETEVKDAFAKGRIDKFPPRSSSRTGVGLDRTKAVDTNMFQAVPQRTLRTKVSAPELPCRSSARKQKTNAFTNVDLNKQSVLSLSSSDDETDSTASVSNAELARREIRASLMSASWDESDVEVGQALSVNTRESERILQKLRAADLGKRTLSKPASGRLMTYLDDRSTETLTQNRELLISFPRTPTESVVSKEASIRESVMSDEGSVTSTKLMAITRQEESLIAAMRLKKSAMKRAQAQAHRKGALKLLELDSSSHTGSLDKTNNRYIQPLPQLRSMPSLRMSQLAPKTTPPGGDHPQRQDSVTTFQTESVPAHSVRSSMATDLTEGSEHLQLPYSLVDGLPIGSTATSRAASRAEQPRRDRDTFLSEMTTSTIDSASQSEWLPSVRDSIRDSHVVVLDPLERQLLREEIPSQLFLERPFIGWEARANMQTAH